MQGNSLARFMDYDFGGGDCSLRANHLAGFTIFRS